MTVADGAEGDGTSRSTGDEPDSRPRLRWPMAFLPEKMGEGLIGPLLPIYAATFVGASATKIGLMEASFQALAVLGALTWGRTSDEVAKRKAFIVLGFVGAAISLVGMAFAESFWALFAWRGVFGFMAAAYGAIGGALVADQSTPATIGERMGLLRMVAGIGYVGGLIVGALLLLVRPSFELFALAGVLSLVSALAALWWIEEPSSYLERDEVLRLFRNAQIPFSMSVQRRLYTPTVFLHRPKLVGTERRAWAYLGAIALSFVGTTAGFVLFPLYLSDIGLSRSVIFALFILNSSLSALLYRPMGRLADRIGYRPVQLGAIGTRSAMFLVLLVPFLPGLPAAAIFLSLAGISWAVLNTTGPAALFRSMAIREKGELIGLYTVAAGGGSFVGALLGGLLAGRAGYPVLFLVSAVLVALSFLVLARVVYPPGEEETTASPT